MDLRGKNAVLTGGARIGTTVARALAGKGVNFVLTYFHSKKIAEKTVAELKSIGVKAFAVKADLSREKEAKKVFLFARKKLGGVDILISMASSFPLTPLSALTEKIWLREIGNTLGSAFFCGKIAGEMMRKNKYKNRDKSRIIFLGDSRIIKGNLYKGRMPYHIAKAGVHMLTKLLAQELAPKIQVNCIAPGLILPLPGKTKLSKKRIADNAGQHWLKPEYVASAILDLLKDNRKTGRIILV